MKEMDDRTGQLWLTYQDLRVEKMRDHVLTSDPKLVLVLSSRLTKWSQCDTFHECLVRYPNGTFRRETLLEYTVPWDSFANLWQKVS